MNLLFNFLSISPAEQDAAYIIQRLRSALPPADDFFCRYVPGGLQAWCRCEDGGATGSGNCRNFVYNHGEEDCGSLRSWQTFRRFTLRVQPGPAGGFVLAVSYDGQGYILRTSIRELLCHHPDTRIFRMAVCRGVISTWPSRPADDRYDAEEQFPLLNPALARWLGMPFPGERKDSLQSMKASIRWFIETHCSSSSFLEAIPHTGLLEVADPSLCGYFPAPQLLFGRGGLHTSHAEGLQLYGPAIMPPGIHFQCFFICFEQDVPAAGIFRGRLQGAGGICNLVRLPMTCNSALNIVLEPGPDVQSQAARKLRCLSLDPEVQYVAFYIHPRSFGGPYSSSRRLYGQLKELLQRLQVVLVGVDQDQPARGGNGAVTALAVRLVTGLGGYPWLVAGAGESDLVAGVAGCRYTGLPVAAACYTGNGTFLGADFTREADTPSVGGFIMEMFEKREGFRRIVIHYLDQSYPGSHELPEWFPGKLYKGIPVVGIGISRHPAGSLLLPDGSSMPSPGTWARTGRSDWLLVTPPGTNGSSLPLNLHITCSTPGYLGQEGVVSGLLKQVHGFCYLRRGAWPVSLRRV